MLQSHAFWSQLAVDSVDDDEEERDRQRDEKQQVRSEEVIEGK